MERNRWGEWRRATNRRARKYGLSEIPVDVAPPSGPCAYCGDPNPQGWDHVEPMGRGGPNTIDNVVAACTDCNRRKSTRSAASFLREPHFQTFQCPVCQTTFKRTWRATRNNRSQGRRVVCGRSCAARLRTPDPLVPNPSRATLRMRAKRAEKMALAGFR